MPCFTLHRGQALKIGVVTIKAEALPQNKVKVYLRLPSHVPIQIQRNNEPIETVVARWRDEERRENNGHAEH